VAKRSGEQRAGPEGETPEISLEDAKRAVSGALLGRQGVHAVGLRRKPPAILLYVDQAGDERTEALRTAAAALAAPHAVELVESERAGQTGSSG